MTNETNTPRLGTDFKIRFVAGLVLAGIAIAATLLGGIWFELVWGVAFAIVAYEWQNLITAERRWLRIIVAALAAIVAVVLCVWTGPLSAMIFALAAAFLLGWLGAGEGLQFSFMAGAGVLYAALPAIVLVWIELSPEHSVKSIVFLFAVVWSADIGAYVAGRLIGGPKLWPSVSPKKTWSGFAGGTLAGCILPIILAALMGAWPTLWLVALAAILAVVSAGGDLFESALKRHYHVKDASQLIPGHGGVMDRLDGFVAVLIALGLLGLASASNPALAIFGP